MRPSSASSASAPKGLLFAGPDQPLRRGFGISAIAIEGSAVPVRTTDIATTPFCTLVEFSRADNSPQSSVLLVAPLSGHFPVLLRDLVIGLLPSFRIYVTDWHNVRHVPIDRGSFGLEDNISCIVDMIGRLPPSLHVVALCQGGVPALAATAVLASGEDARTPATLTLIGSPIDALANPTDIVRLVRSRPLSWFEANLIRPVPKRYAGAGRPVYPAHLHLAPLWLYLAKRLGETGEIAQKVFSDDGEDPGRFPFLDLFTSIMDLDAKFLLENTKAVFHDCLLPQGLLLHEGQRIDLRAIRQTALLTIEGERDDIAAPGQTRAAHALCSSVPERWHGSIAVPRAGHFSLFHGALSRSHVQPALLNFLKRPTLRLIPR
jgi:poly(3-hydroxybutyrate) depolymerase